MITTPDSPIYSASAFYVTWTPVLGEDERITVLVGVTGADGDVSVTRMLSPSILSLMVGRPDMTANQLIDIAGKSLLEHLKQGLDVTLWSAPVAGFTPSKVLQYRGQDMGSIVRQVGMYRSVFYPDTMCMDDYELFTCVV